MSQVQPRSWNNPLSLHGHGVWRSRDSGATTQSHKLREHQTVMVIWWNMYFCCSFLTFQPEKPWSQSDSIYIRCCFTQIYCEHGQGQWKPPKLDNKLGDLQKVREKNPSNVAEKKDIELKNIKDLAIWPPFLSFLDPHRWPFQARSAGYPKRSRSVHLQNARHLQADGWLSDAKQREGKHLLLVDAKLWGKFFATSLRDVRFEVLIKRNPILT